VGQPVLPPHRLAQPAQRGVEAAGTLGSCPQTAGGKGLSTPGCEVGRYPSGRGVLPRTDDLRQVIDCPCRYSSPVKGQHVDETTAEIRLDCSTDLGHVQAVLDMAAATMECDLPGAFASEYVVRSAKEHLCANHVRWAVDIIASLSHYCGMTPDTLREFSQFMAQRKRKE
jgi:hypothetical protein